MTQALYKRLYHDKFIELLYYLGKLNVCDYKFDNRSRQYSSDMISVIL